jgi:midasin
VWLLNALRSGEETLLHACRSHLQLSIELLLESASEEPRIRHLCRPIHDWMKSIPIRDLEPLYAPLLPHAEDDVVNSLLVVAQDLRGWANRMKVGHQEDGENLMRHKSSSFDEAFQLLRFDIIRLRVDTFLENIALQRSSIHAGFEMHQTSIARIRPFLEAYINVTHAFILEASAWMKSVFKLAYIVCSIVQTLAEKGFCKPPDADSPTDGMENGQALEGTGLGDGTGVEDVSKEIEEESQVEGLKGDDTTSVPKGGDQSDAQDAIEMSQDFDGAMEDVDQPKDDEHDGDSDKDSQPDAEDQIGDVDPTDPDAVDEKLWGDKALPEQSPDGQTAEDRSTQKSSKESEIVAKEKEAQPKETKKEGPEQEVDDTTKDDDNALDEEPEGLDETLSNPPDASSKFDDHVKDADALDLPDDMNLDPDNDDPEVDEELNHEEVDSALGMEIEPSSTEDRDQDPERGEPKQDDDTMEEPIEEGGGPDLQASVVADEEVRSEFSEEDGDDDRRVEQPRSKSGITGGVDAVDSVDHSDGAANDELASRDNVDGKNPVSDIAAQEQRNDERPKNEDPL